MIKYITDKEVESKIDLKRAYQWVIDIIKNKDEMILPPKTSLKLEGHIFYNYMPCILPKYNIAGVKVVNRYPNNFPSLKSHIMTYNLHNGDLIAVMEGDYITTIRTGAVAAYSMLLFAKEDYKIISLIGLGNVTTAAFKFFLQEYDGREVIVKLKRYKDHAEKFINKFNNCSKCKFIICDTYEDLMKDSDIIVSGLTYADKDFCSQDVYKAGCTIIPIHTLGFQNCDRCFDKIFGDDISHIQGFKYFNEFKNFHEVTDVVNKKIAGRENNKERILVYNIGIALHDIYFASQLI